MKKKIVFQIALLAALFGGAVYLWMSQTKAPDIEIVCSIHPPRVLRNANQGNRFQRQYNIAFAFNGKYDLSDVKVVQRDEWLTNKFAQPLWHIVPNTNAVPLKSIIYGQWTRGMKPAIAGARPEPLETNVVYRLIAKTRSSEGYCDFKLPALPQAAAR